MTPSARDTHALQRATAEHVDKIQNAALVLFEQIAQRVGIDPRHRYVRADAIDEQCKQHEQQSCSEFGKPRLGARKTWLCRRSVCRRYHQIPALASTVFRVLDPAARSLNRSSRASRHPETLHRYRARYAPGQHDARAPDIARENIRRLENSQVNDIAFRAHDTGLPPSTPPSRPTRSSAFSMSPRRTSAVVMPTRERKPNFGMRICSGNWPPSNQGRFEEPDLDFCPFCPRPQVLPLPEPLPRPTRFALRFDPAAGFNELSSIVTALPRPCN